MTLHPEAVAFLAAATQNGEPALHEMDPVAGRAMAAGFGAMIGAGPEVERVEELAIAVDGGEIAARRYRPSGARGTVVWLHGGGWVLDGLEGTDAMCRILAESSGASVVSVDYRVAPEHPFPVPLEDSHAALGWIAERLEGDEWPLALGGDSAGGNLTAVCALRARERGGPPLLAQVLVYPVTDHDMTTASYLEHGSNDLLLLGTPAMEWFWGHYVADVAARGNPEASPLRAADLAGLPPAIVVIAEYDPLRDEGLAYAERLRAAGVAVTVHRYDDMPHAFFSFVNLFSTGNAAVARVGGELKAMIAEHAGASNVV
jgi:acetyl esterase